MAYLDETGLARFWYDIKQWIASALSNLVHRTGHEDITGRKVFNTSQYYDTEASAYNLVSRPILRTLDFTRGDEAPSRDKYVSFDMVDSTYDEASPYEGTSRLGGIDYIFRTSGARTLGFTIVSPQGSNQRFLVGYDASGVAFASAPSTSSQRNNGTDIVTRDWIPNDTRVVHTTGNETIDGRKVFNEYVEVHRGYTSFVALNPELTFGQNPSVDKTNMLRFIDSVGNDYGSFASIYRQNGETLTRIVSEKSGGGSSILEVNNPATGAPYAWCPPTPDPTPENLNGRTFNQSGGNDILTRDWIPRDTRIVHTTGDENISGVKTFADNPVVSKNNPIVQLQMLNLDTTVASSTTQIKSAIVFVDKNGLDSKYRTAAIRSGMSNDDCNFVSLTAYNPTVDSTSDGGLTIRHYRNGVVELIGVTPLDVVDNSKKLATTEWAFPRIAKYYNSTQATSLDLNDFKTPGSYYFQGSGSNYAANLPSGINGTLVVIAPDTFTVKQIFFRYGTLDANDHFTAVRTYSVADAVWSSWARLLTDKDTISVANGGTGQTSIADIQAGKDGDGNTISSTYLPLFGGTMTGTITRNGNFAQSGSTSGAISIWSGTGASGGGGIWLYGKDSNASGEVRLQAYNGTYRQLRCLSDGTLMWNGQNVQTSSDERLKTPLSDVPDDVLDAWGGVRWGQFQFLDAVKEKGASARLHVGLIAQAVDRTFASENLDVCRYGILCHEVRGAEGEVPAVEQWMARYTEALCMEAAYQRRENARLKKRVADLEERLAALELRLGSA